MVMIAEILSLGLNIYMWIIIIHVAMSWLVTFGVLNLSNPQAQKLVELLEKATNPVMKPIQKYIPPIAGIDISPIIAIIGIQILERLVWGILA